MAEQNRVTTGEQPPRTRSARRYRREAISRAEVVKLGLEIADREGLAGLTMRRLAQDLGVSLATVYATVGSKTDILTGLIEEALGVLSEDIQDDEEDDLEALLRLWTHAHTLLVAHPAVAQLAATRPLAFTGGSVYGVLEETLRRFERSGLTPAAAVRAYTVVRSYLIGFSVLRTARAEPYDPDEKRLLDEVRNLSPKRFPRVRRAVSQLEVPMSDEQFAAGLRPILKALLGREDLSI